LFILVLYATQPDFWLSTQISLHCFSSGEENEENEIIDEEAGDCACPRQSI
jgi:hypothetical protein